MGVRFVDLIEQLDPDDNRRGKQFERICKWFLDNDPGYSFDRIWLWDQWPGRWGPGSAYWFVFHRIGDRH